MTLLATPSEPAARPDDPGTDELVGGVVRLRDEDAYAFWRRTALALAGPAGTGNPHLVGRADVTGRLARRQARLAVLASHVTDLLAPLLPAGGLALGVDLSVYTAPYGYLEQALFDPDAIQRFDPQYILLAGVAEDLLPADPAAEPDAVVSAAVRRWTGVWDLVRTHTRARVLQCTFAVPAHDAYGGAAARIPQSVTSIVNRVNTGLVEAGAGQVLFVDLDRLSAGFGRCRWREPRYWHAVRQPVSLAALPLLARSITAVIAADLGLTRRCVVLDLDNTLWGGVLGEDGAAGVRVGQGPAGEAYAVFQEYLLRLRRRGILLAVSSKNDVAHVRAAFDEIAGMRLAWDDFAVVVADWRPKSEQVRQIAQQLDLGLDSLLFIDDNPAECAEVAAALPAVDVLHLPPHPSDYVAALARRPTLEVAAVTADDAGRAVSYDALRRADALREGAASLAEFLSSLAMTARVRPVEPATLARATQLVTKTNQCNLTLRRRTEPELADLIARPDWICLTLALRDRFADHGIVGLILARVANGAADIDTLLLSCRVIGRTAEQHLVAALARRAAALGCRRLTGRYVPGPRNEPARNCLPALGFRRAGQDGDGELFERDLPAGGLPGSPHIEEELS